MAAASTIILNLEESKYAGIFFTYANIYCMLLNYHKLSHSQIMEMIKKLDEDSHIYRFE